MKNTSHRMQSFPLPFAMIAMLCTLLLQPLAADEGMWTFDNPPAKLLQEKYGFTPTNGWLDHLRLASVRFNDGGSGSFVSPHGLALTNHHVAFGQLQKGSTPQKDYARDGFFAKTQAEEMQCPDLELNLLESMEDVTARVQAAAKPGMKGAEALKARQAEIAKIERESLKATGLRSEVVPLYHGGEYSLYRYKKYTDVRIVFAPEEQAAFFGGDPDNFTYPRYDLDMALFRVYENGKPIDSTNFLKWNAKGAADQDLVFVSGHPGSTQRLDTMSQLEMERDSILPNTLLLLRDRLKVLRNYSATSPEHQRQATTPILGFENSLKALDGEDHGLQDKHIMDTKLADEEKFKAAVAPNRDLQAKYGYASPEIAAAERKFVSRAKEQFFHGMDSQLAGFARTIVEYVAEVKKPDGERLPGYHDSQLDSLRFELFSPAPIFPEMEIARITGALDLDVKQMGPSDPFVKTVLGGKSPHEVAIALVNGT